MIWLWLSAAGMTTTAAIHAILGERRLMGPLMTLDQGIMGSTLRAASFASHGMRCRY
ncbi:hypothetical protein [Sphingopyxis alaskensis]|uniref:hypothetical protein n=1 Tax=Sphingopyxis alaskensis TaxID=117207 RepID=UPI003918BFDA